MLGQIIIDVRRTTCGPITADRHALREAITGDVILPTAHEYDSVRKWAMVRFDTVRPAAVVLCRSPADVSATVAFARRIGLPFVIRSGGHSVAGRS